MIRPQPLTLSDEANSFNMFGFAYGGNMGKAFNPEKLCLHCMQNLPEAHIKCPSCGFDYSSYLPKKHHLQPYTIIRGRYLVGCVIGEGGFGITYSGLDLKDQRHVAIKELFIRNIIQRQGIHVTLADASYETIRYFGECNIRFLQEAEALQHLSDKAGVVDIYDSFEENGTSYIIMEFLDGVDLLAYLKAQGGKISYQDAFALLRPIMKSMIQIHRAGIIHRDISPDNIRYLADHRLKLMDFGSAKFTAKNNDSRLIMVKAGYAPPEQYAQNYKIGPWMDVYAMGATFIRCIAGRPMKAAADRRDDHDIPELYAECGDVTPAIEKVLQKALSLNPENRYQDMYEFYMALKEVSRGEEDPKTDGGVGSPGDYPDGYMELLAQINGEKTDKKYMYSFLAIALILDIIMICRFIATHVV